MTKKEQDDLKFEMERWKLLGWEIFGKLLVELNEVNGDDYAKSCREHNMPPHFIGKTSPSVFHSAYRQGYILKTKLFKMSDRTSRPLPIYLVVKKTK